MKSENLFTVKITNLDCCMADHNFIVKAKTRTKAKNKVLRRLEQLKPSWFTVTENRFIDTIKVSFTDDVSILR